MIDYPGKLTAVVFTRGCNLRCPFCHNPSLVLPEQYSRLINEETLLSFLRTRLGKLDAVTFTGGEPLLHEQLLELIETIKKLGFSVKLDTNGTRPLLLQKILKKGIIDYVAMDIKADFESFKMASGGFDYYNEMIESMEIIREYAKDYEFRTTIVSGLHSLEIIKNCIDLLLQEEKYYLQQFQSIATLNPEYKKRTGLDSLIIDELHNYASAKSIKLEVR